jgi:hypothetical protein
MRNKLNQLLINWIKGVPRTSVSLRPSGYSDDLLSKYVKGRWLESFGHGAYKLYGDKVKWYGGLYTLQTELKSTIHVAGKSALQLKGFAHNIPVNLNNINLFHNDNNILPKWFRNYNWDVELNIIKTNKLGNFEKQFVSTEVIDNIPIKISSPELAILELLLKVPDKESFSEADLIMEGLMNLRPQLLSDLISRCKSVKSKRIFLFLAKKHNHHWLKNIDLTNVDLGSGKRVVALNGRLDTEYNITVPRNM